jgi:hypothetical protein
VAYAVWQQPSFWVPGETLTPQWAVWLRDQRGFSPIRQKIIATFQKFKRDLRVLRAMLHHMKNAHTSCSKPDAKFPGGRMTTASWLGWSNPKVTLFRVSRERATFAT